MAELVDALVSNTNAARRAGSIPALGTKVKQLRLTLRFSKLLFYFCTNLHKMAKKFTIPKLKSYPLESGKDWYVWFRYEGGNPIRISEGINKIHDYNERILEGNALARVLRRPYFYELTHSPFLSLIQ